MKIQGDDIIFNSGRQLKNACNRGVIGLSPDLVYITSGWDDTICHINLDNFDYESLSQQEKVEIADYMIDLWKKAKELALKEKEDMK